ncbi:ATP-binding protein [Methylobacterium nodulans]|uniref:Oxygen sensor histidine kinase NreB n=1 Tax=Methylobacterium nodulans (strain LMG 21967 / CNCM I-2342 / ORS 2060) TaxID=460265 RepID=B8IPG9_METNO|nr:ATP-binding protein [Methylobacterium nodulans]ACL62261.1 histidine kinase [Methylobacterium nodulans ORS 2060]
MFSEAVPSAAARPRLRLPSLWSGRPMRARLMVVVVLINLAAAAVSGAVIIVKARTATQVETAASMAVAEPLVAETLQMMQDAPVPGLFRVLTLRFQALRHVRVRLLDATQAVVGEKAGGGHAGRRRAPAWFARLIAPPVLSHEVPLVLQGRRIGTAIVTTEPSDEIDEVWGYALALGLTGTTLSLAMLATLFFAFGRLLRPLERLAEGLTRLEQQDYSPRLERPDTRELAVIAGRFNRLAEALEGARAANRQLTRQLLTAQDDERRRTALELHDEFGPCLFALEANSASIARIAGTLDEPARGRLQQRTDDIAAIVKRVQTINRALLSRLRPAGLGQAPLDACLDLLLRDLARHNPGVTIESAYEGLRRSYGDLVDLTAYRCVQEGVTNALRHAQGRRIAVRLEEDAAALRIRIADDGVGLAPVVATGRGLPGMRERVEALGGTLTLDAPGTGTVLMATIPLEAAADAADRPEAARA